MSADAIPSAGTWPAIRPVGLDGLLVQFGDQLDERANVAALAFRADLVNSPLPGVSDSSTSLVSAFVRYDPLQTDRGELQAKLIDRIAARDWYGAGLPAGRRLWRIPASFDEDAGPHLASAAGDAGLSVSEAIAELTAARVRVLTIGFAPGQPYLGTLAEHWDLPRQKQLTPQVPQSALVLAVRQLALFSGATQTGWYHIAQTAFKTFRPDGDVPFALRPGDEISFVRVSTAEIAALAKSDQSGDGGAELRPLP